MTHDINTLLPFDLSKAKTPENPDGLKTLYCIGNEIYECRILCCDLKNGYKKLVVAVNKNDAEFLMTSSDLGYEDIREGKNITPKLMLVPRTVERWIVGDLRLNCYTSDAEDWLCDVKLFKSKEEAGKWAEYRGMKNHRISKIEIEE